MIKCALPIVALLATSVCFAAPTAPSSGSSATVTPVPNIAFGQSLLFAPPASAGKAVTASAARAAPALASATAPVSSPHAASVEPTKPEATSAGPAKPESAATETSALGTIGAWWSEHGFKVSDFVLLVLTGFLALYTKRLWTATDALAEESKRGGKTAETAANAAEKSALAAELSANVARISVEASIAAQQPRWIVQDIHVASRLEYPMNTTSRYIVATLVNHGSTAAVIVRTDMRYSLVVDVPGPPGTPKPSIALDQARMISATGADDDFGKITIAGGTYEFSRPTGFDEATLAALEAGTMCFYIVGSLQYRDYLERTWEHSFVGLLDKKRANLRSMLNTGELSISRFIQPPAGPETDPYIYTRLISPAAKQELTNGTGAEGRH